MNIGSDMSLDVDTDTTSKTGMSENLGHGQTSDTRVRSSLARNIISNFVDV